MTLLSRRLAPALGLAILLAVAPVALAAGGGGDHGGEHGDEHGGGEHHACYSCDDDVDGTPNWLDSDAGDQYVASGIAFHGLNLLLLLGIVGWFAGPSIKDAVRGRATVIKEDIDEAARLKAEAQSTHDEVAERLAKLESEIAAMRETAKREAQADEARILERAKAAAEQLSETTSRQIADETARARDALRREAVELAIELAEGILTENVAASDQRRLATEFLDTVRAEG